MYCIVVLSIEGGEEEEEKENYYYYYYIVSRSTTPVVGSVVYHCLFILFIVFSCHCCYWNGGDGILTVIFVRPILLPQPVLLPLVFPGVTAVMPSAVPFPRLLPWWW